MTSQRLSALIQNSATPLHERFAVDSSELREENKLLNKQISRLNSRILELERTANTDPLVPVYNRRAFMREISRAQTVMARYDLPSTVLFFDLNDFKTINDRFGHAIGDCLLKRIGSVLLEGVRDCDMVARIGGDEFAVLLFKTDILLAKAKAATLSCRIADQSVELPNGEFKVTAAWGVAPCEPGEAPERVLDRADRAMYIAKRNPDP